MPIGAVPINQLNALPLLTVAQAASGGDVQVVGGTLYRSFTPAVLGINGNVTTQWPAAPNYNYLVTPYLDLRGCSKFTLTLRADNTVAARAALAGLTILAQVRQGPGDLPSPIYLTAGPVDSPAANSCFSFCTHTPATTFPLTTVLHELQTAVFSWSTSNPASELNYAVTIGSNVRIIVNFGTNAANPQAVSNLWTMYLEGSS